MKNTVLLKNLLSIKDDWKKDKTVDLDLLESMIQDTKKDISLGKISKPSEKKAFNKAMSYLKKLRNGDRPVLGYANKQKLNDGKEYYIFTDSYTLYALKENKGLPLFEELSEEELEKNNIGTKAFPNVARLVPDESVGEPVEILDYDEIVKLMKANPEYTIKYDRKNLKWYALKIILNSGEELTLDGNFLKQTYEILGVNKLKVYTYEKNKPILLINEKGDKALILPINNCDDDIECLTINKHID